LKQFILDNMNLLEYANESVIVFKDIESSQFATEFVKRRCHCFHTYQHTMITSGFHGINFFDNVIKYWDNPKGKEIDYDYNFVLILQKNKE